MVAISAVVVSIGRVTFDLEFGTEQARAARSVLGDLGVSVLGGDDVITAAEGLAGALDAVSLDDADVMIVLQATFADADAVISLAATSPLPIVVWSFPEPRKGARLRLNSLCGANLAAYSLRRRRHPCAFVHIDPLHPSSGARVAWAIESALAGSGELAVPVTVGRRGEPAAVAEASAVDGRLRGSRVGVIGAPPDGFEPCLGDDESIASTFGVEVTRLELGDLFTLATNARRADVDATIERIRATVDVDAAISADDLVPSARLYRGIRDAVDAGGLGAVATRCWPECMTEFGGAVCTPHAMLTEDRVPGVCEADVLGAVTALVLQHVAGTDPFIADLVDLDESDDTSVLWHCGVASSKLADPGADLVGTVHPNRRVPLVNQFALRPGRVTVARVSQLAGGLHLVLGSGEMLDRPRAYDGTSGTLHWDRPAADVARTIFDLGIEHHLGVVYGDHREVLVELARRWGIPVVLLGGDATGRAMRDDGSLDPGAAAPSRRT
ncbi:MAG: hypothetical protein ACE37B_20965 [Ilumatobacter sp.]|jgi:hypothetical protein|uniref:hypothetical protein n=1 Tax=Ilumatobacter sp. TaxID=1967498 RepID=UPI00391D4E67